MLNIFSLANGRLFQEEIESLEELAKFQPIWVDLESPTLEEKRWVKQHYGLSHSRRCDGRGHRRVCPFL
jgi:magnesium transporter